MTGSDAMAHCSAGGTRGRPWNICWRLF